MRLDGFWGQYSILQALLYGLRISLSSHAAKILWKNSERILSIFARYLQPDPSFCLGAAIHCRQRREVSPYDMEQFCRY